MSAFARGCVFWALTKVGRPYIWAAKGAVMWTPSGLVSTLDKAGASEAYDCVGLVTAAWYACGGVDVRSTWNAQSIYDLAPAPAHAEAFPLRLYGASASKITHVAIDLGNGLRLEASGGDSTTTDLAKSLSRPAALVRVGFELRNDLIGFRSLAAMEKKK